MHGACSRFRQSGLRAVIAHHSSLSLFQSQAQSRRRSLNLANRQTTYPAALVITSGFCGRAFDSGVSGLPSGIFSLVSVSPKGNFFSPHLHLHLHPHLSLSPSPSSSALPHPLPPPQRPGLPRPWRFSFLFLPFSFASIRSSFFCFPILLCFSLVHCFFSDADDSLRPLSIRPDTRQF